MKSLTGLRSRIKRLDRRIKSTECEGCTQMVIADAAARYDAQMERPDGNVDRASARPTPCPECGNPCPKIPWTIIDGLTERYDRMQKIDRDLRDRELEETNIDGPGHQGGSIGEDEEK
jgi:hypothetical protein